MEQERNIYVGENLELKKMVKQIASETMAAMYSNNKDVNEE